MEVLGNGINGRILFTELEQARSNDKEALMWSYHGERLNMIDVMEAFVTQLAQPYHIVTNNCRTVTDSFAAALQLKEETHLLGYLLPVWRK